ncbi:TetR family transcriptional regulator [Novosphingobium terrae]|uniref:TetR family transcriptional regulator n=1 Tax=Novosphingobium terrae TaxID=2726189 RepID=UPI001981E196|nr:TetR family transcriptional regulator [Novosphingobium terrae]
MNSPENSLYFRSSVPLERRLVESVWQLWETIGHGAISARALARHAGVPLSTLYNHFPSMEQVFLKAQEEALIETRQWCAAQLEHLSEAVTAPAPASGLGTILAALIDEWTQSQRRLAFAWREGFLLARRDPHYSLLGQGWREVWADFWKTVCDLCGAGQHGEWTSFVFEAEAALHMLSWRRVLDRACLEELCQGWAAWLTGGLVADGPWRLAARHQALASLPDLPIQDETTQHIAAAAANVVERQGMARLTHRAVAAEAGVSLGMVSNRFRTSVDLVRTAFDVIYQRLAAPVHETPAEAEADSGIKGKLPDLTGETMHLSNRLAIEELMLAVARDEALQPFAPRIRYLRGHTSGKVLRMIAGPDIAISYLDAALFSDLLSGMQRAGIDLSSKDRASVGRGHLSNVLEMLRLPATL